MRYVKSSAWRALLVGWLILEPSGTRALEPGRWESVARPAAASEAALVRSVERTRVPREDLFSSEDMLELLNQRAAVMLELGATKETPGAPLAYLRADVLYNAGATFAPQAEAALRYALHHYPESPLAASAWQDLAHLLGLHGQRSEELGAYRRALAGQWWQPGRAELRLNMAEVTMALGDVTGALSLYEQALTTDASPELQALARWGAAVALERSMDLPSAMQLVVQASSARFPAGALSVSAIDLPGVYFSPAYEEHYYRALAAMAQAAEEKEESAKIAEKYQTAAYLWTLYISGAVREQSDKWLENAKRHRAFCLERGRPAAESDETP